MNLKVLYLDVFTVRLWVYQFSLGQYLKHIVHFFSIQMKFKKYTR